MLLIMTTTATLPETHVDLLEQPTFAHLATIRPDGSPQSSPMWFQWDGGRVRMTHTKVRQKFQNIQQDPRVSLSIVDPDDPYRYLELRGTVENVVDDDNEASFYRSLQSRYGMSFPIDDADVRVVLTIRPDSFVAVGGRKVRAGG
jgi:PPOX class probable F420-dependent enzyme